MNNISKIDLLARINWALTPYEGGLTYKVVRTNEHTVDQLRKITSRKERKWGNMAINQVNNGQWTTKLCEELVFSVLKLQGCNPRKIIKKDGFQPDWETDDFITEVKGRSYCISGTAGEKVQGVPYKYADVPEIFGKPLRIICVGYQEYECTYGKSNIFGDVTPKRQEQLDLWKKQGIEYVKFSDLCTPEIMAAAVGME
jgi:hypothetical protein